MHDLESLRKQLGIVNPNSDGNELRDALQARLTVVNNRLRSLNSECLTLDSQIGRLNEQLDCALDEQGKKDRAEQMLQGDGMLSFYRDELAMHVELNKRNISIDDKGLDTLDTDRRLKARREELLEAAAARDTAKAKEYRGQLVIKHRERDRVKEQVAALGLEYEELFTKLDVLSHRRPELAEMQLQVKTMTSNVDALNQQLYKISTAKRAAADQQAAADDPEQAASARRKKQGKLQDLLNQKNDELDRDAAEVNKLRTRLELPRRLTYRVVFQTFKIKRRGSTRNLRSISPDRKISRRARQATARHRTRGRSGGAKRTAVGGDAIRSHAQVARSAIARSRSGHGRRCKNT